MFGNNFNNSSSHYQEWPLSKFSFKISIGGFSGELDFETMDGLGATVAKMEFRDGNSKKFHKQHRPTLTSYDPVTLKKGMFQGDSEIYDWFSNVSSGALFGDARTVTIKLTEIDFGMGGLGGSHRVLFQWTLDKAYVTKFTPPSLDGGAESEPAVEELEISYQSFTANANPLVLPSTSMQNKSLPPINLKRTAISEDLTYQKVDLTREVEEADTEAINAARAAAQEQREKDRAAANAANEEARLAAEAEAEAEKEAQKEAFDAAKQAQNDAAAEENEAYEKPEQEEKEEKEEEAANTAEVPDVNVSSGLNPNSVSREAADMNVSENKDAAEKEEQDNLTTSEDIDMEDNSDDEKVDLTREADEMNVSENDEAAEKEEQDNLTTSEDIDMEDNSDDEKVDLTREVEERDIDAINAAREEAKAARDAARDEQNAANEAAREKREEENEKKQDEQRQAREDAIDGDDD